MSTKRTPNWIDLHTKTKPYSNSLSKRDTEHYVQMAIRPTKPSQRANSKMWKIQFGIRQTPAAVCWLSGRRLVFAFIVIFRLGYVKSAVNSIISCIRIQCAECRLHYAAYLWVSVFALLAVKVDVLKSKNNISFVLRCERFKCTASTLLYISTSCVCVCAPFGFCATQTRRRRRRWWCKKPVAVGDSGLSIKLQNFPLKASDFYLFVTLTTVSCTPLLPQRSVLHSRD